MFRPPPILLSCLLIGGCGSTGGPYPSLQPRAAEAIDPRVPVERPLNDRPVTPALAAELAGLVAEARAGDAAFGPAAIEARRLADAAGPAQSESWIVAQQALSVAIGARAQTVTALSAIDSLGAARLQDQGGLSPNDLAAVREAGATVGEIDSRQAATVAAIQARLGS